MSHILFVLFLSLFGIMAFLMTAGAITFMGLLMYYVILKPIKDSLFSTS